MKNKGILEFWVGLFVVAGVVALGVLAFKVAGFSGGEFTQTYKITARFGNVGGLSTKAPVNLAGVRIGRVTAIRIDPDHYNAVVEMSIDSRYDNLPMDTSASILTQGLLGSQFVGLNPGGDEIHLEDGDEVMLTQSAVVLEQLISQMLFSKAEGGE
ncbi:MAG: putative phospholipid ABC transporter-binding protein MlaD [Gammaproteobacteria bacterium]|nr:putative phospholipid ABC transporter-binding protein MlaD [Gammaproteobacteria bacterium]